MSGNDGLTDIDTRFFTLDNDSKKAGYYLNPDTFFTKSLIEGLITNEKRYGYAACPCRLAMGTVSDDRDIICPCDYRDADLTEFGACYCGLYLTKESINAGRETPVVPERRPKLSDRKNAPGGALLISGTLSYPVLRCRVCGYLTARDNPPEECPICKAKSDRFEVFISK
jgi:ferredoxin-thioredoxin reductase catalytic subunit